MTERVTTRRIIKPGTTATLTPPSTPALEPRPARMWAGWQARFAERERAAAAGQMQERAMWAGLPMQSDKVLAQQVATRLLEPWETLQQTFDLAATTADLPPATHTDYLAYLDLRVEYYRAVVRRCLTPSPASLARLQLQEQRLDAFIEARRHR